MNPVVLGFDVSPTKIGWGAVCDETGDPIACGVVTRVREIERVQEAVADLAAVLDGREPLLAYVEENFQVSKGAAFDAGFAVGVLQANLRRRWATLPMYGVNVMTWRRTVGIPTGPVKRAVLKAEAVRLATGLGFDTAGNDDAAEGALIAVCGRAHLLDGTLRRTGGQE